MYIQEGVQYDPGNTSDSNCFEYALIEPVMQLKTTRTTPYINDLPAAGPVMPHSYVYVILKQKLKRMLPLEFPEAPHSLELFFFTDTIGLFFGTFWHLWNMETCCCRCAS